MSKDRGQAYTLEGFIGAIIILTALLFAVQSVVIAPTTGGAVDRTVQAQLQQEVQDSLVVAEGEGDLSELIRNWDTDANRFGGGERTGTPDYYETGTFANESTFGDILETRFGNAGHNYNVDLIYADADEPKENRTETLVYQGSPSSSAVTASHTVTLYEDQHLTADGNEHVTLERAADEHEYPVPNEGSGAIYNVVEVRVVLW